MTTSRSSQPDRMFRFGSFELSEREGELRKNGARIKLQEHPLRVLLELVSNGGRLVTREELQQKLWPADTFVDFDVGVNTAIRKLRQALGDEADNPRFIETLARRGYRFVAPVTESGAAPESITKDTLLVPPNAVDGSKSATDHEDRHAKRHWYWVLATSCAIALVIYGAVEAWRRANTTRPLLTEQRITANPPEAPITGAVVSPDGKYVAYSDTTGVYIRHIDSGETRPLPLPIGFDAVPTSWFADSMHVLVGSGELPWDRPSNPVENPTLWRVSILGGSPQKLVENAWGGAVSPDGSKIAFLRGCCLLTVPEVWTSGGDGSSPRRVFKDPGSEDSRSNSGSDSHRRYDGAWISRPAWSPDGGRIAYVRCLWVYANDLETDCTLESIDVNGGPPKVLESSSQLLPDLAWAADGRLLYAERNGKTSERVDSGIWSVRVNPRSGEAEQKPVQLTTGVGRTGYLSVSADGKRLVLLKASIQPEVLLTEIDGKTRKLTTPRRLTLDQNGNVATAWTPDSRAVLFSSNRNGTWKLFRQAIDQVAPELLVDGRSIFLPRLDPDGTHVLYMTRASADDTAGPVKVMKVSLQGGSPQVLLQKPSIANIQCARGPSRLCLLDAHAGGSAKFFSFDPDNGETTEFGSFEVTQNPNWSLSPDGAQLALILSPGVPKITFMAVSDKGAHEVEIKGAAGLSSIDWAGDGKSVFVVGRTSNGTQSVWNAEPSGDTRVVLVSDKQADYVFALPSPDERYVALEQFTGENNVWMVENF